MSSRSRWLAAGAAWSAVSVALGLWCGAGRCGDVVDLLWAVTAYPTIVVLFVPYALAESVLMPLDPANQSSSAPFVIEVSMWGLWVLVLAASAFTNFALYSGAWLLVRKEAAARGTPMWRVCLFGAIAAGGTVAAYLIFLPWDAQKYPGPDGSLHGPYEPKQVIGLVVALIVIGMATGWFSDWIAPWVVPPVLTLVWCMDALNDVQNDGLWPVGAGFVLVGSALVTLVLVLLGRYFTSPRAAAPAWYADPTGAAALRWWDGDTWSEHTDDTWSEHTESSG